MKKLYYLIKVLVIVAVVAVIGYVVKVYVLDDHYDNFEISPASIKKVTGMVKLSTLEIHDEAILKDSINSKWLVARESVDGAVTINLEHVTIEEQGDTTLVILPAEQVEVYESNDPNAYEIIDTYDVASTFIDREMTADEENQLKRAYKARIIAGIYERGLVRRARANAVQTLSDLYKSLNLPVKVVDLTPEGTPPSKSGQE